MNLSTLVSRNQENRAEPCRTYPERQLLIGHEGLQTGLALPVTGPHLLPGGEGLVAVFVTGHTDQQVCNRHVQDQHTRGHDAFTVTLPSVVVIEALVAEMLSTRQVVPAGRVAIFGTPGRRQVKQLSQSGACSCQRQKTCYLSDALAKQTGYVAEHPAFSHFLYFFSD